MLLSIPYLHSDTTDHKQIKVWSTKHDKYLCSTSFNTNLHVILYCSQEVIICHTCIKYDIIKTTTWVIHGLLVTMTHSHVSILACYYGHNYMTTGYRYYSTVYIVYKMSSLMSQLYLVRWLVHVSSSLEYWHQWQLGR